MSKPTTPVLIDNSGIDPQTNFSLNPTFAAIVDSRMARRKFLKGSMGAAVAAFIGGSLAGCSSNSDGEPAPVVPPVATPALLGFTAVAAGRADAIVLDRNIFTFHQQNAPEPVAIKVHELFKHTLYRAAFRDAALQRAFDKALLSVLLDNWYEQLQLTHLQQRNQDLPNRFYCDEETAAVVPQV